MADRGTERHLVAQHIRGKKTEHGAALGVFEGFRWLPMVVQVMEELVVATSGSGWVKNWPKSGWGSQLEKLHSRGGGNTKGWSVREV